MATSTASFLATGDNAHRSAALDEAVCSMVTYKAVLGRFCVTMPVVLASGSYANVVVWQEGAGDSFMVTDDGAALFEVTAGAFSETSFKKVAAEKCAHHGAVFDGTAMLYIKVSAARLKVAIITMANLVKEVVDETVARSIGAKANEMDHLLWEKLGEAFGGKLVQRRALLIGESNMTHQVTAAVQSEQGLVVFDNFSAQGNSINSVYVKMADLGRIEVPPKRFAVTTNRSELGSKLNLITAVAQVMEISVNSDSFRKMAEAA
jgi:hypothetical protein